MAGDPMRDAFEAFLRKRDTGWRAEKILVRNGKGYALLSVQGDWEVWQAAWNARTPPAQQSAPAGDDLVDAAKRLHAAVGKLGMPAIAPHLTAISEAWCSLGAALADTLRARQPGAAPEQDT